MEVAANKALFWTQELRNPARYTHVDFDVCALWSETSGRIRSSSSQYKC
jgi:hypothetical protein